MSTKIKALGLGLLAALAVSAVAVVNATANGTAHFTSSAAHTNIIGEESGTHQLHFKRTGAGEEERIGCDQESYTGTTTATTVTTLTITPSWSKCTTTTSGGSSEFEVHENGCTLTFAIDTRVHNKVHVLCPPTKAIEITHPNCNITVPPQTVGGETVVHNNSKENGVVYTTDTTVDKKHSITMDVTVTGITSHYHSFGCQFIFGTVNSSEMRGSVTVRGVSGGNNVDITATGS